MSFGSFQWPWECIMHFKNITIGQGAPGPLDKRHIQEREASLKETLSGPSTYNPSLCLPPLPLPTPLPLPSPLKMLEREARTPGQEGPAQRLGVPPPDAGGERRGPGPGRLARAGARPRGAWGRAGRGGGCPPFVEACCTFLIDFVSVSPGYLGPS